MISASDILHSKILIVDDLEANIVLLEDTLRSAGYVDIMTTLDSRVVCNLHQTHSFTLILLDIQMPHLDGFQVMECLKKIESESYLPVLAITAYEDHKLRALKAGAKDFISLPFNLSELLVRIRNMLEVRLLHEAVRDQGILLKSLASKDPLTGLANRRVLSERLTLALIHARRNKSSVAVVYLDLDGFKKINDTLGHDVGDVLLQRVAGRLVATVREEDLVARIGGDEFIITLWNISGPDYASTVALKMIEAVMKPYDIQGKRVCVSASAGVSIYPLHGNDSEILMKSADRALYEAKKSGKNQFRVFGEF